MKCFKGEKATWLFQNEIDWKFPSPNSYTLHYATVLPLEVQVHPLILRVHSEVTISAGFIYSAGSLL